jgi:Tetratricopeptide repeat
LRFNLRVEHLRDREAMEQAVVRGSELLKQGKVDQAQLAFRDALALEPDNPRVLALLGLSQFRAGAFGEARAVYEQLVERAPTDASHRLNLGLVYLKLNDAERAISSLEASRALDPSQGRAVSYLGLAYARAGRYAEAYRAFLLAGQNDLASEIETNLTVTERDRIHQQLGRSPQGPLGDARPLEGTPTPRSIPIQIPAAARPPTPTGAPVVRTPTPTGLPVVARTPTPTGLPVVARTPTPTGLPVLAAEPEVTRTPTPHIVPRTKPPSAPPAKSRPPSYPGISEAEAPAEPAAAPGVTFDARDGDVPAVARTVTPGGTVRITDSLQFVMPRAEPAAPEPLDGRSMISYAVASATPSPAAAVRAPMTGAPRPLSDIATDDLVRPDEGSETFEIGPAGALIVRVGERVMTRLDGVHITGGDLVFEVAVRRSRGHNTDERFDYGGSQLHAVSGRGYLIALPGKAAFTAVSLDDDILYLREDLVFAFEASLRWENGNVPGLRGKLPVVQFRGDGAVALRLARPLVRVKLPAQGMVFVDADRLAGWIGRVIPRAVVPPPGGPLGAMCVECTGEGIVLVEPAAEEPVVASEPRRRPPPPPPAPVEPAHDAQPAASIEAGELAEGTSPDVRIGAPADWHGDSPGDWHGDSPIEPPIEPRSHDPFDEL